MDLACASNAVRELTQHLDSPGEEHWNSLRRLVGYLKRKIRIGKEIVKPKALRIWLDEFRQPNSYQQEKCNWW